MRGKPRSGKDAYLKPNEPILVPHEKLNSLLVKSLSVLYSVTTKIILTNSMEKSGGKKKFLKKGKSGTSTPLFIQGARQRTRLEQQECISNAGISGLMTGIRVV